MSWIARLLIGLTLLLAGAAAAVWALARYDSAARFVGVKSPQPVTVAAGNGSQASPVQPLPRQPLVPADAARIGQVEARLAQVERATRLVAGSAGRTDALVIAFAARRAIDRGVSLGFLENLLVDRFGATHQKAVATVITAARQPVRLDELIDGYREVGPQLRGSGPEDSWWSSVTREFGSLVEIRRTDVPSTKPETRYRRAADRLSAGDVEGALTETMRLPGAARAADWVAKARRYVAAHRALDELESAALMSGFSGR